MPLQIYSRRLWNVRNFAGGFSLLNPGPDLYIVRTVTAYWGGLSSATFALVGPIGEVMLFAELDPTGTVNMVWDGLRLVWPAGETWELQSSFGLDMTGHGYQLTPP